MSDEAVEDLWCATIFVSLLCVFSPFAVFGLAVIAWIAWLKKSGGEA